MHRGPGPVDSFQWLHTQMLPSDFGHQLKQGFAGCVILIACFDSGLLVPSDEQQRLGWSSSAAGMLSPPLHDGLQLPFGIYSEWWIFEHRAQAQAVAAYECFVNYQRWTLRKTTNIERNLDESIERTGLEWLIAMQGQFWSMVSTHQPLAYIANGEATVVASRHAAFMEALAAVAEAHDASA